MPGKTLSESTFNFNYYEINQAILLASWMSHWKGQALQNCERNPFIDLADKETSAEALRKAFYWRSSPEGHEYWEQLYLTLI
jgi:hypothetical protein